MTKLRIAAGVLALFVLAGCSSSKDSDDGVASAGGQENSSAAPSVAPSRDLAKWAECMRGEGLQVSDPNTDGQALSTDGSAVSQEKLQAALKKCQPYVTGTTGKATDSDKLEAFLKLAKCMRDNGYPMPDPQIDESGEISFPTKIDRNAPNFKTAQDACRDVGPKGGPGSGS
ncbi:hypothetical protein [Actinoplanes sp. NPDC026619]|uniref:hypothetical protein n=1 Tax=Actinoplanes sp. NPDC026619 TaxID=3155798 RepID=UPI0033CB4F71